jgi:cell division protein FtsZ
MKFSNVCLLGLWTVTSCNEVIAWTIPSTTTSRLGIQSTQLHAVGGSSTSSTGGNDGEVLDSIQRRKQQAALRQSAPPILTSRNAQKLERGAFLGFQKLQRPPKNGSTQLRNTPAAVMPDGGLSPCVIRVLGVGGGGCNAVSL